jgi:hypothetical protein
MGVIHQLLNAVNTGFVLLKINFVELHTPELKLVEMTAGCVICQIS